MLFILGFASMCAGEFCINVTIAGNDYGPTLRWGTVFAIIAAACFTLTAIRGSRGWRILAAVSALPLVHIAVEMIRRG